jgi:hypothetical protein
MTPAIFGGILLILGAYQVYKGNIFRSVMFYTIADIIWITLAISVGDYIGASMIATGGTLGFLAFIKMHKGDFNKTIRK